MAKSLLMVMLVSTLVIFFMSTPIFSQEIDQYSEDIPEEVDLSPGSDFDLYVEGPDEAPFDADSPATEYDMQIAQHYSDKQLAFLEGCLTKQNPKCGDAAFKNLLNDSTQMLSDKCCRDMLKLGKDCHLGLFEIIFSSYEYKNFASKALPKSKQMWNDCVRRVGSQIGVPVSLEN